MRVMHISLFVIEESGLKLSAYLFLASALDISLFVIEESGLKLASCKFYHAAITEFLSS